MMTLLITTLLIVFIGAILHFKMRNANSQIETRDDYIKFAVLDGIRHATLTELTSQKAGKILTQDEKMDLIIADVIKTAARVGIELQDKELIRKIVTNNL